MLNPLDFSLNEEFVGIMKVLNRHSIVATTDAQGLITHANDRFCEVSGYSHAELVGQDHTKLNSGVHPPGFFKNMYETTLAGKVWEGDICNRAKDGHLYWLQTTIAVVWDVGNKVKMFVSIQTDISTQKKKHEQLELLQACIDLTNDVILITEAEPFDLPGPRIVYVNQTFEILTGYSREEVIGKTPRILQGKKTDRAPLDRIRKALSQWTPIREELLNYTKDGQEFWAELEIAPIANEAGWYTHWISVLRDITQRKVAEAQTHELAYYDTLTKLPNRRLLMDRLSTAIAAQPRNGAVSAVLFINLDHFKTLNDTLGFDSGDNLLTQVSSRLVSCVPKGDTVARAGGDEFVIILEALNNNSTAAANLAEQIARIVLASLGQPYQLGEHQYDLTASIGITFILSEDETAESLLKQADIALSQAKLAGRDCIQFFDLMVQERLANRARMLTGLRHALEANRFELYYQPQVDASGYVVGAEALIRWHDQLGRIISPGEFIPLAEETGLIVPIGRWVLDEACAQLKRWQVSPMTCDLTLSVNISAKQFLHPDFVAQTQDAIVRHKISPSLLELELTESVMLTGTAQTFATLIALKELGMKFSLDDFGTGYSSLQYLKAMPLDKIKIDQAFVRDLVFNDNDKVMVETIIRMAKALKLDVIAEGVETNEQQRFLVKNGCHHLQGYLFGRPVPIDEFEANLAQQGRKIA